jgi:hypothetical protein
MCVILVLRQIGARVRAGAGAVHSLLVLVYGAPPGLSIRAAWLNGFVDIMPHRYRGARYILHHVPGGRNIMALNFVTLCAIAFIGFATASRSHPQGRVNVVI